jgi:hypothetical protein
MTLNMLYLLKLQLRPTWKKDECNNGCLQDIVDISFYICLKVTTHKEFDSGGKELHIIESYLPVTIIVQDIMLIGIPQ